MEVAYQKRGGMTFVTGVPPRFDRHTWRVLTSAGADAGSVALYYYLLDSEAPPEGEWQRATEASTHELAEGLGLSRSTVMRHLRCLKDLGAIQRRYVGRRKVTYVQLPLPLVKALLERPAVVKTLQERYPTVYCAETVQLEQEEDNEEFHAWVAMRKEETRRAIHSEIAKRRYDPIMQAVEEAKAKTEAKREYNRTKPAHQRMRKGKKASTMSKEDHAPQLMTYLRRAIKTHLSNFPPHSTQANIAKIKQLRDRHGAENVRKVIDWITEPAHWARVRRECRISSGVPTPGILLGFDTTIFPMALEADKPKRSGGAIDKSVTVDPNMHEL